MKISLLWLACTGALPLEVCPDVAQQLLKIKGGSTIDVNINKSAVYIPTRASKL